MNRLGRAALGAFVVVCTLAAAPAAYAADAEPAVIGRVAFAVEVGGWLNGWVDWLADLLLWEERAASASIQHESTADDPDPRTNEGGCADPWGVPNCKP